LGEVRAAGKKNGHGTLILPSGEIFAGQFDQGVFQGLGTYASPNGDKDIGRLKNGKERWLRHPHQPRMARGTRPVLLRVSPPADRANSGGQAGRR